MHEFIGVYHVMFHLHSPFHFKKKFAGFFFTTTILVCVCLHTFCFCFVFGVKKLNSVTIFFFRGQLLHLIRCNMVGWSVGMFLFENFFYQTKFMLIRITDVYIIHVCISFFIIIIVVCCWVFFSLLIFYSGLVFLNIHNMNVILILCYFHRASLLFFLRLLLFTIFNYTVFCRFKTFSVFASSYCI